MSKKQRVVWWTVGVSMVLFAGAALLYPVLARQRHPRHNLDSVCRANLKQLSVALEMYAQDYWMRLPPGETSRDLAGEWTSGRADVSGELPLAGGYLAGYYHNSDLWICNLDPERHALTSSPDGVGVSLGYQWNSRLAGRESKQLGDASQVACFWDRGPWHDDGHNVAFVDGHVAMLSSDEFDALGAIPR